MDRYLKFVFVFFLFAVFVLEGLGINNGRQVVYNLILLMPFFLFIPHFLFKEKHEIVFPKKLSFLFLTFFVLSAVSAVFGVNLQNSFENLVLYLSLFLVFIFAFNNKEILKSLIVPSVFILGLTFSVFSMFANFFIKEKSLFFIPIDFSGQGYQFIYSAFGSHNHLGDFLLLPLTIIIFMLFSLKNKHRYFLLFLVFLPYFIFSYSRSAYLDLALIILLIFYFFIKSRQLIKKWLLLIVFCSLFIVFLAVFLFAVPTDTKKPTLLNSFNITLQQKYNLSGGKLFLAYRNKYATEGLYSISKNPLFGIGPGNFIYASTKYTGIPGNTTVTSHNLFFDVFVENGIFAGMAFLMLFLQILYSIRYQFFNHKSSVPGLAKRSGTGINHQSTIQQFNNPTIIFIFLFLAMLLNFQTDYIYLIRSFFLLFFVLIGLIYEEKQTINLKPLILFLSLVLFLIFNLTTLSNLAISKNNYSLAFYSYPLNKEAYVPLINNQLSINNKQPAFRYLGYFVRLFNGDQDVLTYAGDVYYSYVGEKEALPFYEKAFNAYKFADPALVKKIYQIKLTLEGQKSAKEFADKYFSGLSAVKDSTGSYWQSFYQYRLNAFKFCKEVYKNNCPYGI